MPTVPGRPRLRGSEDRLLKGYAPGVVIVAALLLAAFLVPTVAPEQSVSVANPAAANQPVATQPSQPSDTTAAQTNKTSRTVVVGGTSGQAGQAGTGGASAGGATPPATESCPGRQVPNDPYSPPCVQWTGANNGGSTSKGVTATTINLSARELSLPSIGNLVAQFDPDAHIPNVTEAEVTQTVSVFINYFNTHFQMYGRKIVLKPFTGQGNLLTEVLGGGQAQANSDALTAADQEHAFADILSLTAPYSQALAQQGVIALNQLYFSQQWYQQQGLYAYSAIPDCTKVVQGNVSFIVNELRGQNAIYAGGSLKNKPRKIALVVPDAPMYSECASEAVAEVKAAGIHVADVETYPLDLNDVTNTVPKDLVDKFSGEGITTVVMATDPVLPFFMTNEATEQDWYPEWIITGIGLTDTDYVGQLYTQSEWDHSFGVSFLGSQVPDQESQAWAAYSEAGPPGTQMVPLIGQLIYQGIEMFAIGIQEAGPDLTPATFRAGLERYPEATGEFGTWQFTATDPYTPEVDSRVIWWNPTATSTYDDNPGAYQSNGHRYPIGQLPAGPPPVYLDGPPGS